MQNSFKDLKSGKLKIFLICCESHVSPTSKWLPIFLVFILTFCTTAVATWKSLLLDTLDQPDTDYYLLTPE